jgi:hypothetical protein
MYENPDLVVHRCPAYPMTPDEILGRVENRRSGGSLPVAIWQRFRFAASVRFGLALFPVPAHRTGHAELPHQMLLATFYAQCGEVKYVAKWF